MLLRSETPREQLDRATYDSCPGPIVSVEKEQFSSHGLYLQPGESRQHTLYVVHHGTRESVEVFEVDADVTPPQLTWVGAEYVARADVWPLDPSAGLVAMIQIESARGIANLDEILDVPGIGAIFLGPTDLAKSMDEEGPNAPRVEEQV